MKCDDWIVFTFPFPASHRLSPFSTFIRWVGGFLNLPIILAVGKGSLVQILSKNKFSMEKWDYFSNIKNCAG